MARRLTSLFLALVLVMSTVFAAAPIAHADEIDDMVTSDACIAIIKEYEGFAKYPVWDYGQYSVGYGTRCPADKLEEYQKNGISEEEADALLREFVSSFEDEIKSRLIRKYDLNLTQNQFDALVSFSYNCGTGWLYTSTSESVFYNAIINGATDNELIRAFALWCSAGGEVLTYLLERRLAEANMYLNAEYSRTAPENYCYVLYDANGGETSPRTQGYSTQWTTIPYPVPTNPGHTFVGWYTEPVGGVMVTSLTKEHNKTTLYAHWADSEGNEPEIDIDPVTVTVTGVNVNVRKGPGTHYATVGNAQKDEKITITQIYDDGVYVWGKFDRGWIALMYTTYNQPDLPVDPEEPEEPDDGKTDEPREDGIIATGKLNVNQFLRIRSGPGTGYPEVGRLSAGDRVAIYEMKTVGFTVWARIDKGWISMDYVIQDAEITLPDEPSEPAEPDQPDEPDQPNEPEEDKVIATGKLNVKVFLRIRSGPGTNYSEVGLLYAGDSVSLYEIRTVGSTKWGRIDKGWISMDYVILDPEEPSVPEEPETPVEPEEPDVPATPDEPDETGVIVGVINVNQFLRIRSGPGTNYTIAGYLDPKARVEITETVEVGTVTWGKIEQGWISMEYVTIIDEPTTDEPDNTPETDPEPDVLTGVINVNEFLRVRSGPGTSYSVACYLEPKSRVTITEVRDVWGVKWGKIEQGWISMDYVVLDDDASEPQTYMVTITASRLNVRKNPGTNYVIVGYYYRDNRVEILETTMVGSVQWGRTELGWISMEYTK